MAENTAQTNANTVVPPSAADVVKSILSGTELQGTIWKDGRTGAYQIDTPGKSRYGNAMSAAAVVEEVNGRQIAVSGLFEDDGLKNMERLPDIIRTLFLNFLNDPSKASVQHIGRYRVRFAQNPQKSDKSPVAHYFIRL